MTSAKQTEANRRNAKKSTGPKTHRGKNVVRFNAVRHGLTSENIFLPGENEEEFNIIKNGFYADFSPQGQLESFLVDQMIIQAWRLLRLSNVETGIYKYMNELVRAEKKAAMTGKSIGNPHLERYLVGQEADRILSENKGKRLSAPAYSPTDDDNSANVGEAFLRATTEADAFTKISRYETTIRTSFYNAYGELARLQEKRRSRSPQQRQSEVAPHRSQIKQPVLK